MSSGDDRPLERRIVRQICCRTPSRGYPIRKANTRRGHDEEDTCSVVKTRKDTATSKSRAINWRIELRYISVDTLHLTSYTTG